MVGVERRLPRHHARLLARPRPAWDSSPSASPARPTSTSQTAASPFASINFITAHDGFTLRDLVSYNDKHNEANQEDNRDGTDDNRSWNCGAEGETDDPAIHELRRRQQRNFLTTLFVSQGTPMLLGGDELSRSQGGNNNAWCQDNEISWYDWDTDEDARADARVHPAAHPPAARALHVPARDVPARRGRSTSSGLPDVWWFRADGRRMTSRDWEHGEAVLGMFLNGEAIPSPGPHGEEVEDDSFVLLFNAHAEDREFKLPRRRMGARWELELCTADPDAAARERLLRRAGADQRHRPLDHHPQAGARDGERTGSAARHLPPAAHAEFGFAARARTGSPTCATSASPTCTCRRSLQARAGSTHGYDVVDPTRISEDLGGEAAFRELAQAAHAAGLGIVLDLVPNHMATDDANRFWADPELREQFFDIDPATGRHRRFFDIDDLAGVRQEDPEVFEATHALVLGLVRDGVVDALRIDHPDGLADPAAVLPSACATAARSDGVDREDPRGLRAAARLAGHRHRRLRVPQRRLRAVRRSGGRAGRSPRCGRSSQATARPFAEVAAEAKLEQAIGPFAPEMERLAGAGGASAAGGAERARRGRWPRSRSTAPTSSREAGVVADADRRGGGRRRTCPPRSPRCCCCERPAPAEFVTRFQQTTPPVVAKGVEDTAFYRYARLLALCDVGGDPGRFGIAAERFHAGQRRARGPLPRGDADDDDPRHQALGRRARAASPR